MSVRFVQKRTQKTQAFDSATLPRWHFDGLLQILKRGLAIRRVGSGLHAGMAGVANPLVGFAAMGEPSGPGGTY